MEEEERVKLTKIRNRQNLPHVLKIECTFLEVCSSMIYDLTIHYYSHMSTRCERSKLPWQVVATQEWLLALPDVTDKPQSQLFSCSYIHSHLHPHTSYNSTGCAIYSTHKRFYFHHSQNRKSHALSQ